MIARAAIDERIAETAPRLEPIEGRLAGRVSCRARVSDGEHAGTWGACVAWIAARVPETALVLVRGFNVPRELVPVAVLARGAGARLGVPVPAPRPHRRRPRVPWVDAQPFDASKTRRTS